MKKVYIIKVDVENGSYLLKKEKLPLDYTDFECKKRKDWVGIELYIHNPKYKYFTFNKFDSSALCIREDAPAVLFTYLEKYGELLGGTVEKKGDILLFNCLKKSLCFEEEYEIAGVSGSFYKLNKDKIEYPIFKLKEQPWFPIFCTSGFFPEDQEFYHIYHKLNLTGLLFEEVKLV